MSAASFARPPAEGNLEELRVYAWAYTAGYELAAELGRPALTHLRDQLEAASAEIGRRDAEDAERDREHLEHVRRGTRGDTRSHLEVLRERAARSGCPEIFAAEIARAERHYRRVWDGWSTSSSSTEEEAA